MYEVLARVPFDLTRIAATLGVPTKNLFAGLSFSEQDVHDRHRRVPWNEFAEFLDRLDVAAGSPDRFEQIAFESIRTFEYYRRLTALFVDARVLYEHGTRRIPQRLYGPAVRGWCQTINESTLRVGHEIVENYRACWGFAYGSMGAMRALPLHLGLPPASVQANLGPRRCDYIVTLPPSATIPARLRRAQHAAVGALVKDLLSGRTRALQPLVGEALGMRPEVSEDVATWRTEAAAIATCSDLGEYVQRVQSLLINCFGFEHLSLWTVSGTLRHELLRAQHPRDLLLFHRPLVIEMREVGCVAVSYGTSQLRALALLEEMLPLLAFGLESTGRDRSLRAERGFENERREWDDAEAAALLALEAIPNQAFVITGAGDVLASNQAGTAGLQRDGAKLRQVIKASARHAASDVSSSPLALSPLAQPSLTPGRMLAINRETQSELERRVRRAKVAWKLTNRQAEVLNLVVRGRANKEIASVLSCAVGTVEIHMTQMLRKAGADSRATMTARFWTEVWAEHNAVSQRS